MEALVVDAEKPSREQQSGLSAQEYDPILSASRRAVPLPLSAFCLAYAVVPFLMTCVAAALEGRLFSAERGILPLWSNFSTLLDFVLLNPLGLYYLLRSYRAMRANGQLTIRPSTSGSTIAALVVAVGSMAAYMRGFIQDSFYDACYIGGGIKGITFTGWIVCFWTTTHLYFMAQAVLIQSRYIVQITRLKPENIHYQPFEDNSSEGVRPLAQPALEFLRFLVVLLVTFIAFYVYDDVVNSVHASNRMIAVLVYLAIAPPLFLVPVMTLHRLMMEARNRLLAPVNALLRDTISTLMLDRKPVDKVASEMEALSSIRRRIKELPVWPLPVRQMIESTSYLLGPVLSYTPKLLSLIGFV